MVSTSLRPKMLVLAVACLLLAAPTAPAAEQPAAAQPAAGQPPAGSAATTPDPKAPVATVAGTVLTQADLTRELEMIRARFQERGRQVSDEQLASIRDQVLDRMIRRELLYLASQKEGFQVDGEELDRGMEMVKAQYADDKEFTAMLGRMGLDEAGLRRDLAKEMAIKKFIDARFASKVEVSDDEVKAYYEKTKETFRQPESVHASHILVKVAPDADEAAKAKAREKIAEVQKKLAAGGDFAALAREYSEGPSAANGGDLGYFRRGQMVKPFEDAAFGLEPGKVSDLVTTRFGYHLIKVHEHVDEAVVPLDAIKDRIRAYLEQEKVQAQVNAYIDDLKAKSEVTIN